MRSKLMLSRMLLAFAILSAIFFKNQLTYAQNVPGSSQSSQSTQPAVKPSDQNAAQNTKQQRFTGVIAKSGDRLVLTDPLTKTSY